MADLDELALSLPETTKDVSADGRPSYLVHGKLFCCHRNRRRDAVDVQTGERLDDILMFRVADLGVKELLLADDRGVFFTDGALRRLPRSAGADTGPRAGGSRRAARPADRGVADARTEAGREGMARREPRRRGMSAAAR
jgi:hypothetical protein